MASPDLILTGDGSHSLFNVQLNETYHSVHGALQESRYVFIKQGLEFWCERNAGSPDIFEVGFGTGLNALLSLEFSKIQDRSIHYVTVEAYPLDAEVYRHLNYGEMILGKDAFDELHRLPWEQVHAVTKRFSFEKHQITLQNHKIASTSYDVVFFDAFAPSKQPEMWDSAMLAKVVAGLRPSGVFVTYCARGQLKRDLRDLGLTVQTLTGPPGKKEMVRAVFESGKSDGNI